MASQIPDKKLKLYYLHYILNENNDSLIAQFFKAQDSNPIEGDWVSEVRKLLIDLNIYKSFEDIKNMKKTHFQKLVNEEIDKHAFTYLTSKIKSKGSELDYSQCYNMQDYLRPNNIFNFEEQKMLFSYRTRMNNLDYNFPGRKNMEHCQCGFINITNEHLFECDILNNNEKYSHTYQQLLNGTLSQQKILLNILNQSMKNHKKFSQAACAGS